MVIELGLTFAFLYNKQLSTAEKLPEINPSIRKSDPYHMTEQL